MPLEFEAFTAAFQGITFGQSNMMNIVPVIMCFIIGLAITRNVQKITIIQLPLAVAFAQVGLFVGYIPLVVYTPMFIISILSIQGIGDVITGTVDKSVKMIESAKIGMSEGTRTRFRKENVREQKRITRKVEKATQLTAAQRFSDERREVEKSFKIAKRRQAHLEGLSGEIQPLTTKTTKQNEKDQLLQYWEEVRKRREAAALSKLQKQQDTNL